MAATVSNSIQVKEQDSGRDGVIHTSKLVLERLQLSAISQDVREIMEMNVTKMVFQINSPGMLIILKDIFKCVHV